MTMRDIDVEMSLPVVAWARTARRLMLRSKKAAES